MLSADLDLAGARYVVTGANTGVGRATALALARRGAHVVLACRSAERARPVVDEIARGPGSASLVRIELADLASVRQAAREIAALSRERGLDGLVNNAGVGGARGASADGLELAFASNHLGHYLLTRTLLPVLRADAVVVHLASGSHRSVRHLDLEALRRPTASLTGVAEYARSKLCVMLFHHELTTRFAGSALRSLAADPGDVASDAYRHVPWPVRAWMTRRMPPPAHGARTVVRCATDRALASGGTYADERPREPSVLARDASLARALWERSAEWVGLAP